MAEYLFIKILKKGQDGKFDKFQDIVDLLSEDPLLSGKQVQDWQDQFIKRLEYNIKSGVFRIVIASAPLPSISIYWFAISLFSAPSASTRLCVFNSSIVASLWFCIHLLNLAPDSHKPLGLTS